MANFMRLVFLENDLVNGQYAEPYAGGAGVAFQLLFNGYASHIHINDLNKSVHAFWRAVLEDSDNLCRLIYDIPVNIENWERQKNIQQQSGEYSELDLAFSTFFLNRTNRSGIINGGVIGGKNQDGNWKIDARYNKEALISRIERVSRYEDQISLYNYDAAEFLTKVVPDLPTKSLVYLDPPYYIKGRDLYENHYSHDDHIAISNLVATSEQKWIVSYDDTPEIRQMYAGSRELSYQLSYSAAGHYKGSEIMFFSDNLIIPDVTDPAKIKSFAIN